MLNTISNFAQIEPDLLIIFMITGLAAGMVRGFSGFALSAIVMSVLSNFLPPVEIVTICLLLEIVASIMMTRGGIKTADMGVVWGLVIGCIIGTPIGYGILTNIDAATSRLAALSIITGLAILLLLRVKARFLATRAGLYASGVMSGVASMVSVAGMVVALYVLAQDSKAKEMRGTLVMFLMISLIATASFQFYYDIFTVLAVKRALIMTPMIILGIMIGTVFFRPSLEKYYKPFSLFVLIVICLSGLYHQLL